MRRFCAPLVFLFSLTLAACDPPPSGPPTRPEAVAVALRTLLGEAQNPFTADRPACVAWIDQYGITDPPMDLIADVMAANPGLRPVSTCRVGQQHGVFLDAERKHRLPLLHCTEWAPNGKEMMPRDRVVLDCGVHWGPLAGRGFGFDVTRDEGGEIVAVRNGTEWVE